MEEVYSQEGFKRSVVLRREYGREVRGRKVKGFVLVFRQTFSEVVLGMLRRGRTEGEFVLFQSRCRLVCRFFIEVSRIRVVDNFKVEQIRVVLRRFFWRVQYVSKIGIFGLFFIQRLIKKNVLLRRLFFFFFDRFINWFCVF